MKKIIHFLFITATVTGIFLLLSFIPHAKGRIVMIGDSTMSVKEDKAFPENGWGMALAELLDEKAEIKNFARNGRSTKSFINEGLWDKALSQMNAGDYVIIQFGHNDEKSNDSTRYTLPQTSFKENLRKFINDSREKGAVPVLCTPIVRRKFSKEGKLVDTHGEYPQAVREIAVEMNVPLVDLEKLTAAKLNDLGPEQSKSLYMILAPGEYTNFPEGKDDNTHLQVKGAATVAALFVEDAKKQQLSIAALFR